MGLAPLTGTDMRASKLEVDVVAAMDSAQAPAISLKNATEIDLTSLISPHVAIRELSWPETCGGIAKRR
jgi:hypothetical protein